LVEAIRRTGQTVAKNVLNELKVLEEVAEEAAGKLDIDSSLPPNSNNNVEAQTDLSRNETVLLEMVVELELKRVLVKAVDLVKNEDMKERKNQLPRLGLTINILE
jgi:hypothetical protein